MILQRPRICFPLCSRLSSIQSADSSPALHFSLLLSLCYPREMLMVYYLAAARVQHVMPLPAPWGIVYQRICCGYMAETLGMFTCTQQFCFRPYSEKENTVMEPFLWRFYMQICAYSDNIKQSAPFSLPLCTLIATLSLLLHINVLQAVPFFAATHDLCMHPHTTQRFWMRVQSFEWSWKTSVMETLECLAGLWKKNVCDDGGSRVFPGWHSAIPVPLEMQEARVLCVANEVNECAVQSLIPKADWHEHIPHGQNRNSDVWRNVEIQKIQPDCAVYMTCIALGILPYSE